MQNKLEDFPHLKRYRKVFPVNDYSVFAYDNTIFCNHEVPEDIVIHEQHHFKQQKRYGLENWVNKYLEDKEFRLRMEIEAYRKQLKSIKHRELKHEVLKECARNLSSTLYGNIISYEEALKILT